MGKSKWHPNKDKNTTVRTFVYGLGPVIEGADVVRDQIRAGHRYLNKAIAIKREARKEIDAMARQDEKFLQVDNELREVKDEISTLKNKLRRHRVKMRAKGVDEEEIQDPLRKLRKRRKKLKKQQKQERNRVKKERPDETQAIYDKFHEQHLLMRKSDENEAYWGTYLRADRRLSQIIKSHGLRFRRYDGTGCVAVQLQKGRSVQEVFSPNDYFYIVPPDERAWFSESRSERRRLSRTTVSMRVKVIGKTEPVMATWSMIMHRPFPDGWRIKEAAVVRGKTGRNFWDKLIVTVESPEFWRPVKRCGQGILAIDIGWRARPNGRVRFAFWKDDDGNSSEELLDPSITTASKKSDGIRSTRDQRQLDLKADLIPLLDKLDVPEWFAERVKPMDLWKSCNRFHRLARFWEKNRFAGDRAAFELLERWRYKDQHLWNWEANNRKKMLRRRKHEYQKLANKWAEKYAVIVMEDITINALYKKKKLGDDADEIDNKTIRKNRTVSAVGSFRDTVSDSCFMRGTRFMKVSAANTSRTCPECGHVNKWTKKNKAELMHTCEKCGAEWDRDYAGATELLRRACEELSGEVVPSVELQGVTSVSI